VVSVVRIALASTRRSTGIVPIEEFAASGPGVLRFTCSFRDRDAGGGDR
jgi:hypothetical protein